ncbi:MAG: phosphoenolpyruvate--protein phosphotransferase [Clostridia bacterium]|nr:phosphoenolpyruvate--protein phosphotransferase [Clostridia bacterium]
MQVLDGQTVFGGIAIGPAYLFTRKTQTITLERVENIHEEIARFEQARLQAQAQLGDLYERAQLRVGEENAEIFNIHAMMLDDADYCSSITHIIRTQSANAEYAVGVTADNFSKLFSGMDDAYMRERAADVRDVSERLVRILSGETGSDGLHTPSIIFADDLAPSETVQLDREKVLAFVTAKGSKNSHTAILARTMNIPAIIGVGAQALSLTNGQSVIVDGFSGKVYINPDAQTKAEMQIRLQSETEKKNLLKTLKGMENKTLDGRTIKLYANIGGTGDVAEALQNDAGGIGLLRSEFLYIGRKEAPDEQTQFNAYRTIAQSMAGRPVIIRTLDIGADKKADYLGLEPEENPALGYRAVRICLDRQDLFKTQLRAIYRASAFGSIAVMIPMIVSEDEVLRVKEIIEEVKAELDADRIDYAKNVAFGIMIETPAAALISDRLAKHVDFFSIGTNDLTQYILAADRQNAALEPYIDTHHPALLRLIQSVAENAHKNGIWVGICGELGADPDLTEFFLSIGIDELSVSPPMILPLRQKIRNMKIQDTIK